MKINLKNVLASIIFLSQSILAQHKTKIVDSIDYYNTNEAYNKAIVFAKQHRSQLLQSEQGNFNLAIGKSYENLNKEDSAFAYYQMALKIFRFEKLDEKIAKTNQLIYNLLDSQNNLNIDKEPYFIELQLYANKSNSKKWLAIVHNTLGIKTFMSNPKASRKDFLKSLELYEAIKDYDKQANVLSNLGVLYTNKIKDTDSARYFLNKAVKLFKTDSVKVNTKFNIYNNIGNAYKTDGNYLKAIEYFKMAEVMDLKSYNLKSKKIVYSNIDASYYYLNDFERAYTYFYKYDSIKELINLKDQNALITDVEERYQNEKLRADNLESEAKRKTNKNLFFVSLSLLLFGGITAFLIQKNTKRKQLLAEQEKELETQKLATVLKEQELKAIDAMIEGQEKERQQIANDLHDDLGSIMANVKLHFNALKEKNTPELFDKTNHLIDEAYLKVRTVAHAKNSGVIAKQGLLKAVQNLSDKVSQSNKITIEVIDHGLEDRFENSLELTIFRIIQELITNIVKHSGANQATVYITNHNDSINIMVEDNGKGFNPNQVTKINKGMGISSIDKRIAHLNGTMTIESEPKKGTTIIIDIPI